MGIIDYDHKAKVTEKRVFDDNKVTKKNKKHLKEFLDSYDVSSARKDIFLEHIRRFFYYSDDIKKRKVYFCL